MIRFVFAVILLCCIVDFTLGAAVAEPAAVSLSTALEKAKTEAQQKVADQVKAQQLEKPVDVDALLKEKGAATTTTTTVTTTTLAAGATASPTTTTTTALSAEEMEQLKAAGFTPDYLKEVGITPEKAAALLNKRKNKETAQAKKTRRCVKFLKKQGLDWDELQQSGKDPEEECRTLRGKKKTEVTSTTKAGVTPAPGADAKEGDKADADKKSDKKKKKKKVSQACRDLLKKHGLSVKKLREQGRFPNEICRVLGDEEGGENKGKGDKKKKKKKREKGNKDGKEGETDDKTTSTTTKATPAPEELHVADMKASHAVTEQTVEQLGEALKAIPEAETKCKDDAPCLKDLKALKKELKRKIMLKLHHEARKMPADLIPFYKVAEEPDSREDLQMALKQLRKGYKKCGGSESCIDALEVAVKGLKERIKKAKPQKKPTQAPAKPDETKKKLDDAKKKVDDDKKKVDGDKKKLEADKKVDDKKKVEDDKKKLGDDKKKLEADKKKLDKMKKKNKKKKTTTTTTTTATTTVAPTPVPIVDDTDNVDAMRKSLKQLRLTYTLCGLRQSCVDSVEVAVKALKKRIARRTRAGPDVSGDEWKVVPKPSAKDTVAQIRASLRSVRKIYQNCDERQECLDAVSLAENDLKKKLEAAKKSPDAAVGDAADDRMDSLSLTELRVSLTQLEKEITGCQDKSSAACQALEKKDLALRKKILARETTLGETSDKKAPRKASTVEDLKESLAQVRMGYAKCAGRQSCMDAVELAVSHMKKLLMGKSKAKDADVVATSADQVAEVRASIKEVRKGYSECSGRQSCLNAVEKSVEALNTKLRKLIGAPVKEAAGAEGLDLPESMDELKASLKELRHGYARCQGQQVCLESVEISVQAMKRKIALKRKIMGDENPKKPDAKAAPGAKPEPGAKPAPGAKPEPAPGAKPEPAPGAKPEPAPGAKPEPAPVLPPEPIHPATPAEEVAAVKNLEAKRHEVTLAREGFAACGADERCLTLARERLTAAKAEAQDAETKLTTIQQGARIPVVGQVQEDGGARLKELKGELQLAREGFEHCAGDEQCLEAVKKNVADLKAQVARIEGEVKPPAPAAPLMPATAAAPVISQAEKDAVVAVETTRKEVEEARAGFAVCQGHAGCLEAAAANLKASKADHEKAKVALKAIRDARAAKDPFKKNEPGKETPAKPNGPLDNLTLVELKARLVKARASYPACKDDQACLDKAEDEVVALKARIRAVEPLQLPELKKMLKRARSRYLACGADQACLDVAEREVTKLKQDLKRFQKGPAVVTEAKEADSFEKVLLALPVDEGLDIAAMVKGKGDDETTVLKNGVPVLSPEEDKALQTAGINKYLLGDLAPSAKKIAHRLMWYQGVGKAVPKKLMARMAKANMGTANLLNADVDFDVDGARFANKKKPEPAPAAAAVAEQEVEAQVEAPPAPTATTTDVAPPPPPEEVPPQTQDDGTVTQAQEDLAQAVTVANTRLKACTDVKCRADAEKQLKVLRYKADIARVQRELDRCGEDNKCATRKQREVHLLYERLWVLQGADPKTFERRHRERKASAAAIPEPRPTEEPIDEEEVQEEQEETPQSRADGDELDHVVRHRRRRRSGKLNMEAIYRRARRRIAECDGNRACVTKVREAVAQLVSGKFSVRVAAAIKKKSKKRIVVSKRAAKNMFERVLKRVLSRCEGRRSCVKKIVRKARAVIVRRIRKQMVECNGAKSCVKAVRTESRKSLGSLKKMVRRIKEKLRRAHKVAVRRPRVVVRAVADSTSNKEQQEDDDADFDEEVLLEEAKKEKASCEGDEQCLSGVREALRQMVQSKIRHVRTELAECSDDESCTARLTKRLATLKDCLRRAQQ